MAIIQAPPEISLALDNDVFSHWRNNHPYVREALDAYESRHKLLPALTSITVFEALKGIEAAAAEPTVGQERNLRYRLRAKQLIDSCIVLPFDQNAAAIAAYIFPRVPRRKLDRLWGDIFIAATAMAHR